MRSAIVHVRSHT